MVEQINNVILALTDPVLGWLLRLPSDLRLFAVAILTSLIMRLVRLFAADQDLLRRAAADKRRLNELVREARRNRDRDAVKRFKANKSRVAMRTLKCELMPLLASLVPIVLLASWCWSRLEFHPPAAGETVEVRAYTPVSAIGDIMHIVPRDGLAAEGWIRPVRPDAATTNAPALNGVASWRLTGEASAEPFTLTFRFRDEVFEHRLAIGGRRYEPALVFHPGGWCTEVRLRPVKLFGLLPGVPQLGFAPWLTAYVLIVCLSFPVLKRVTGIH